jgi:hypothetical protein
MERAAGDLKYRKVFVKNTNAANIAAEVAKLFVENFTAGEDAVTFFPGSQTNIQSAITGAERLYGCGQLDQDTATDAIEIDVLTEDADLDYFQDGDLIRISDKADIDGVGNEEYVYLYGDPVYVGDVATLVLQTPLMNTYDAANTRVASVYEPGSITTDVSEGDVTTGASGTFSDGSHPILGDNRGTIEQNWTLTFSSAVAYAVAGDTVGAVGAGGTGANFAPNNPATATPYFTIDYLAFGGAFQAGDTITFSTSPAAVPLWYRRQVPAGAAAEPNDRVIVAVDFESA